MLVQQQTFWSWLTYLISVSMLVYFQFFILFYELVHRLPSWCWHTACITAGHHLTMVTVDQGMLVIPVDHSEQLPDSISTWIVKQGLLYVVAAFVCFVLFFFYFFFYSSFYVNLKKIYNSLLINLIHIDEMVFTKN